MTQTPSPTIANSDRNAAVIAGFLGWTLDAFDFAIMTFCLPDIAATYHLDRKFITFCVPLTMMMRPIGAFIFGLLADRYGRRTPMMLNLIFYSCMSILSGLAPSYRTFLICRALFGIGMGGEWGVGASLALEKVPARFRGLISGLLQEGYAVGGILASLAGLIVYPLAQHWHIEAWWRILFLLGGLPAIIAIYIRAKVKESAVWEKAKKDSWSQLGSALVSNWRIFLSILILMTMMNLASHGTQDLFPSLLKDHFHLDKVKVAGVTAFSQFGMICGGIVMGFFSDKIGRKRAMIISFICGSFVVPLWAYAPNMALLLVGSYLLQFFVQGAWGVIPAHINELSPDSVRGFLPGFAYQCGAALAGGVPSLEEKLKDHLGLGNAMALSAIVILPLAAIVVALGKQRTAVEFGTVE